MSIIPRLTNLVVALGAIASLGAGQRPPSAAPVLDVFKSATCGCCAKWVEHMRANGFDARVTNVQDLTSVKKKHGVPDTVLSCHTATVNGYVVEGHVPAGDVHRLLKDKPAVAGIGVPNMPTGSPGMEVEGVKPQPYNVLSFDKQGMTRVYAKH